MHAHDEEYSLYVLPRQSRIPKYKSQKLIPDLEARILPSEREERRTWPASDRGIPNATLYDLNWELIVPETHFS